jgi:hypothetical protein
MSEVDKTRAQPSSNEKLSDERLQDIYGRVRSLAYPQQAIADMLALLAEIKLLRSAHETSGCQEEVPLTLNDER